MRRLSALAARPVHAAPRASARCASPGARAALAAWPVLWACGAAWAQQTGDAAALAIDRVVVVGTTPLPGPGVDLRDVPANVQRYTARDLASRGPRPIGDFLDRVPTGVVTQSAQGNPYQPDVSFRGFAGSPVLGTPQGISVFQDGVRINEPFGDAVNWDLIPRAAIADIQFVPGTQPVYGLNTLGGAIALRTKDGRDLDGVQADATTGAWGRRSGTLEWGGARGAWDGYVAAHAADERGWAEHSPSRVRQGFARLGWRSAQTEWALSWTGADNRLEARQTLPASFLSTSREAYTWPDLSINRLSFFTLTGTHQSNRETRWDVVLYKRQYRNDGVSSNLNPQFGSIDPATGVVDTQQGTLDTAAIDQSSDGVALQALWRGQWAGLRQDWTLGVSVDRSRTGYRQWAQDAVFDASRGALPAGPLAATVDAATDTHGAGVYVTGRVHLPGAVTATLGGRRDSSSVRIRDRSGADPALDGDHRFARFNPSAGLTWQATPGVSAYVSRNDGMRAPTAIELTCADPQAPCKLPNNFLADPPLRPVVARTLELGARGGSVQALRFSAAVFRTRLADDIQFVSAGAGAPNAGTFVNVGATERRGLELALDGTLHGWALSAHYSFVDARFGSGFVQHSPDNPSADAAGNITVRPGDRLAGVPRHTLKLALDGTLGGPWAAGLDAVVRSGTVARGNENQGDAAGTTAGYALLNAQLRYRVSVQLDIGLQIDNVFDRRSASVAVLGRNAFAGPQRRFDPQAAQVEPFFGVGAPRAAWLTVSWRWP